MNYAVYAAVGLVAIYVVGVIVAYLVSDPLKHGFTSALKWPIRLFHKGEDNAVANVKVLAAAVDSGGKTPVAKAADVTVISHVTTVDAGPVPASALPEATVAAGVATASDDGSALDVKKS